jgi:hypothetical protein
VLMLALGAMLVIVAGGMVLARLALRCVLRRPWRGVR